MRNYTLLFGFAVAGGMSAACGEEPTRPLVATVPGDGLAEVYQLETIGGQPLPSALIEPPIESGSVIFGIPGIVSFTLVSRMANGLNGYEHSSASYRRTGSQVSLTFAEGDTEVFTAGQTLRFPPRRHVWGDTGIASRPLASALRTLGSTWRALPETGGGNICGNCGEMSSCPLVYSWDGARWHLDSGTFAAAIAPGFERTEVDVLAHATAIAGRLRLRMTNELPETEHVDALEVVAVDHAPGSVPVPDPTGRIHLLRTPDAPLRAYDRDGRDVTATLAGADGRSWESTVRERDPALRSSLRDGLELRFRRPPAASRAWLVLDAQNTPWAVKLLHNFVDAQGAAVHAWYLALSVPGVADLFDRRFTREGLLQVAVARGGSWVPQGFAGKVGPEVMKRQAVPLDLSGLTGDVVRVRLEGPPSVWRIDAVALALEEPAGVAGARPLALVAARTGGRDVRGVLGGVDRKRLTLVRGDTVELLFAVPAAPPAAQRTYLLRSTGWYRIQSRTTGSPEFRTLARIATDRDGMARLAVEWGNARIRAARMARQ